MTLTSHHLPQLELLHHVEPAITCGEGRDTEQASHHDSGRHGPFSCFLFRGDSRPLVFGRLSRTGGVRKGGGSVGCGDRQR